MVKPIYIFSGFIDSGKTTAIKNTLRDPRFNEGEKSLLIVFEQGDEEYDEKFLKETNSVVEYMDFKDFNKDKQKELDNKYKPERVFIEFNGVDDDTVMFKNGFIRNWEVAQVLTTIDASNFKLQMVNLKQFMYNHIRYSEVAVLNRSDNEDLRYLRNNIKGINQRIAVIFEDKDGNVTDKINDQLFDVSKPISVSDMDYGLWYMDALDNPTKYEKVTIEINAFLLERDNRYSNVGLFGRKAMVCCSNDIQNIAFTVVNVDFKKVNINTYYHIKGRIHCLNDTMGNKTCVIYADEIVPQVEPKDSLVYFN